VILMAEFPLNMFLLLLLLLLLFSFFLSFFLSFLVRVGGWGATEKHSCYATYNSGPKHADSSPGRKDQNEEILVD